MSEKAKPNYKDTLNLPKTDFAMKANLTQREPEIQKRWAKDNLYEKIREKSRENEKYVFHDGPPYANGPIHLGHLLNKVLKDIVVRSKTMEGYDVDFIPGWDCHGLPIEHKVLKELGDEAKDYTRLKIRNKCQNYADKFVRMQAKQMLRLGTTGNYENPYLTMVPEYESGVLNVFADLVEEGLVYRDLKPVHWSIENQTALADAELEYHEKQDKSIYVLFELEDVTKLPASLNAGSDNNYLIIWTTTPWTLPANLAVAVAPNGDYGNYQFELNGKTINAVIVDTLAENIFSKAGIKDFIKTGFCKGKEFAENGISYHHPFIDKKGKMVSAEYVTFEDGTGLVHTAPGHGVEDYQTGLKEGLDIYCPVKADGTFDDTSPEWLSGIDVWKGNELVIENLKSNERLFFVEDYTHSYPHDWRSKTPTIFRATEQWFIAVDKPYGDNNKSLRENALECVESSVRFYPEWGKNRFRGMIESRPDWCISRQRSWGLPIPAFTNEHGETLLTPATVRLISEKMKIKGSNIWFLEEPDQLLDNYDPVSDPDAPEWIKDNPKLIQNGLSKGMDIFDVWFESGSSWNSVLKSRDIGYPADLYLEGSDQHRGWFQLSLLPALGATGEAPFKAIFTHGFMVDAQGKKMSKSGGNALEVDEILKKHGADVCRWWVSTLKFANDIKVDWEFFKVAADEYRKVRNTIRFLLGNLSDFDITKDKVEFTEDDKHSIDYWAYAKLTEFVNETREAYSKLDYKHASELIFSFCYDTLSAVYIVAVKDRLYCDKINSRRRKRTQTVLYAVSDSLVKLLAPILVHTADEAYLSLTGRSDIHIQDFPLIDYIELDSSWYEIIDIREKSLKELEEAKERGISNPLDAGIRINLEKNIYEKLKPYEEDLADLCGVSRFNIENGDGLNISIDDLSDEPRCERSWKRDETVKERSDGGNLSDRDAEALGLD